MVTLHVVNAKFQSRKMRKLAKNADYMQSAFEDVGKIVRQSVRRNFAAGGRPDRWQKRKDKKPHPILLLTRALRDSVQPVATSRQVDIVSDRVYAATHQWGRGNIPARPYMVIQDEDRPKIREAIINHLTLGY